ncbi:MAG: serine/threonine-protein kinase, partial [Myxococcota bacterium]
SWFGRYRLHYELASGGMGTVYIATVDGSLPGYNRVVALKHVHGRLAALAPFRDMFLDEVRIASRLNHPNAVSIVDFGEVNQIPWYAMNLVLGERFSDAILTYHNKVRPDTKWNLAMFVAHCAIDACEGLHAAHELRDDSDQPMQVVHRDISPQNLLVGYDGRVRVVDFGVAKALDRLHRTATGEFKGRLAYAAPEQIEEGTVDRRADVWSMGVVLWEALTGRRLFRREKTSEMVERVLTGMIPGIRELDPELPPALDEVVAKALQRDPDRRYQNARQMGRELRLFLSETEHPFGVAEVAETMDGLFPGEHALKRQYLGQIRKRLDTKGADHVSEIQLRALGVQNQNAEVTRASCDEAEKTPRNRARWSLLTGLFVGMLLGLATAFIILQ